jgi:four helix bundle protein
VGGGLWVIGIWKLAEESVIEIHAMTLNELPKFEQFEEASQIRRSIKSVKSAIVEGYGRKKYQQDYLRFLIIALSSNDETIDHLENLFETHSLKNEETFNKIHSNLELLVKKLNCFIQTVEKTTNQKPVTSNK